MELKANDDRLLPVVQPLIAKMGYSIVELKSHTIRDAFRVNLIIYRVEGITLEDCSAVYRTLLPRLEVAENRRDIHLEVSSPGLFRTIKSAEEFRIFRGREVRILGNASPEWSGGIVLDASNESVVLDRDGTTFEYHYRDIIKAKLDSLVEGET